MKGHHLQQAAKFEREEKEDGVLLAKEGPHRRRPKGRPGKSGLRSLTKKMRKRKDDSAFPTGLGSFQQKGKAAATAPSLPFTQGWEQDPELHPQSNTRSGWL